MSFFPNVLRPHWQAHCPSVSHSGLISRCSLTTKMLDQLLRRRHTAEEAQGVVDEEEDIDVVPLEVRHKSELALSLEDVQQEMAFWEAEPPYAAGLRRGAALCAVLASEASSLCSNHGRALLTMTTGNSAFSKQRWARLQISTDHQVGRTSRKQIAGNSIQEEENEE